MMKKYIILIFSVLLSTFAQASVWYSVPASSKSSFACFRTSFVLNEVPQAASIKLACNSQYRLFVNDIWVGLSTDTALFTTTSFFLQHFLKKGTNTLIIEVWNSNQQSNNKDIAIFVETNTDALKILSKADSWKYILSTINFSNESDLHYNANSIQSILQYSNNDIIKWSTPITVENNKPFTKNILPPFILKNETLGKIIENSNKKLSNIQSGKKISGTIAANSSIQILVDKGSAVAGFIDLKLSGGANASIRFKYCEANCLSKVKLADSIQYKGVTDSYISNGEAHQRFIPFKRRCFRYIIVEITTQGQSVHIDQLSVVPFSYPFDELAYCKTDNDSLNKAWLMWAKMQKLYVTDHYHSNLFLESKEVAKNNNMLAINTLLLSGDAKLMSNYLLHYEADFKTKKNRTIEFADLQFVSLASSFYHYTADTAFLHSFVPTLIKILDEQLHQLNAKSLIYNTSYLPSNYKEKEVQQSLRLSILLTDMANLLECFRLDSKVEEYRQISIAIKRAIMQNFRVGKGLFFYDDSSKHSVSQYTASLAIQAGLIRNDERKEFSQQITTDSTLLKVKGLEEIMLHSVLYNTDNKYIIKQAITQQIAQLQNVTCLPDQNQLAFYFGIDILENLLGIRAKVAGYKEISVEPNLTGINKISVRVPLATGAVYLDLKKNRKKNKLKGVINLPEGTKGVFIWEGKQYPLVEADNKIEVIINQNIKL